MKRVSAFIFCKVLGWHKPYKNAPYWYDGCSVHSTCKRCGKEVMRDSQGNWF